MKLIDYVDLPIEDREKYLRKSIDTIQAEILELKQMAAGFDMTDGEHYPIWCLEYACRTLKYMLFKEIN